LIKINDKQAIWKKLSELKIGEKILVKKKVEEVFNEWSCEH